MADSRIEVGSHRAQVNQEDVAETELNDHFDFPFVTDPKTVEYIKKHGRLIFVIRGLPKSKKGTLREILKRKYSAVLCSAVDHIHRFIPEGQTRYAGKANIEATIQICQKELKNACNSGESVIIVSNSHIRRREMTAYLSIAAEHGYTVILINKASKIPLMVMDNTVIDSGYVQSRSLLWEECPPLLTGWFMSPNDTKYLHYITLNILYRMLGNKKFCKEFKVENIVDITNVFHPRKVLNVLAGYDNDATKMEDYYLQPEIQEVNGKVYKTYLVGFLITKSHVMGIVQLNSDMKKLMLPPSEIPEVSLKTILQNPNFMKYGQTTTFCDKFLPSETSVTTKTWKEGEEIKAARCSFIHLAQTNFDVADMQTIRKDFYAGLQLACNDKGYISENSYSTLNKLSVRSLENGTWLVKTKTKVNMKTIFTGLYF